MASTAASTTTAAAATTDGRRHRRLSLRRALLWRRLLRRRAALCTRLDRRVDDTHDRREQAAETGEHLAVTTTAAATIGRSTGAAVPTRACARIGRSLGTIAALHARQRREIDRFELPHTRGQEHLACHARFVRKRELGRILDETYG